MPLSDTVAMMRSSRLQTAVFLCALLAATGCGDDFGFDPDPLPFSAPDTATLFSIERSEYQGLPGAYDFANLATVRIEDRNATNRWDIALTETAEGLALAPEGALLGIESQAAIAVVDDVAFDALDEAPESSEFQQKSVPLSESTVYVVRTRQTRSRCVNFAKFEPLDVDVAAGTLRFTAISNPNCNDRALVPEDD